MRPLPNRARRQEQSRPADTLTHPISVFLSSSQQEFETIRQEIKADLDEVKIADRPAFVTTLVELERGEQIGRDIEDSLRGCDIYVLLIGNRYSEWTVKEFENAWNAGLPMKAYLIRSRRSGNRNDARRQRSFLEQVHNRIRLEGKNQPYSRERRQLLRLYNDIANDLAAVVLRGIHNYVEIKRIIRR